jgi:hypothetical protein
MAESPTPAVAFYSWGRWVANCPNPDCSFALQLTPAQARWECSASGVPEMCGTTADVEWPTSPTTDEVTEALAGEAPQNQSWSPGDVLP